MGGDRQGRVPEKLNQMQSGSSWLDKVIRTYTNHESMKKQDLVAS